MSWFNKYHPSFTISQWVGPACPPRTAWLSHLLHGFLRIELPAPCDSLHRQATDDPGSDIPIGADLQEPAGIMRSIFQGPVAVMMISIMISIFDSQLDEYFSDCQLDCVLLGQCFMPLAITLYMMDHVMCMYFCKRRHMTKLHCFMSSLVDRLSTASFSSAVPQICVEDFAEVHHRRGSAGGDPLLLPLTLTQNHLLQSFDLDVRDVSSRLWDLERRGCSEFHRPIVPFTAPGSVFLLRWLLRWSGCATEGPLSPDRSTFFFF